MFVCPIVVRSLSTALNLHLARGTLRSLSGLSYLFELFDRQSLKYIKDKNKNPLLECDVDPF